MKLFDALGFRWDRSTIPTVFPAGSVERACFRFHRMLTEFVWDAGVLEGNPFTFPEVKTLLDGVTVGGKRISDHDQILNLAESSKNLLALVKAGAFELNKETFCDLQSIVARGEALECGHFRGEGQTTNGVLTVAIGEYGTYTALPTLPDAPELNRVFEQGVATLKNDVPAPFEQGTAFFLFGALQQFFFDGNKRTSRFMMNGILMSNGIDAISVPAAKKLEFNEKMSRFYVTRDGSEMIDLLVSCHPESDQLYKLNPNLVGNEQENLEHDRRIAELSKLKDSSGASYTFYRLANEAIKASGNDAFEVDWTKIEEATIRESIGEHGQHPDKVYDTLCEHSPGAARLSRRDAILATIKHLIPQLQSEYRQVANRNPKNDPD